MYSQKKAITKPTVSLIKLSAYPPFMQRCFDLLKAAGAHHYALFGGAIRDADYMARHQQPHAIKDYDLRIWLPKEDFQTHLSSYLQTLGFLTKSTIHPIPCPGTDEVHYCIVYEGIELDISVRPIPAQYEGLSVPIEAVACDRARLSDVAISGVAIDPIGRAWAQTDYLSDQTNDTLTIHLTHNKTRRQAYTQRMSEKFPNHRLVFVSQLASAAVFFNSDDLLHHPAQLRVIADYAKKKAIPLYVMTTQPETFKTYIVSKITEIDGLNYDGIGGFKSENIHCLGPSEADVSDLTHLKLIKLQSVHQKELSYLPKTHVVFSDNVPREIDVVKKAGYLTRLSKDDSSTEHLDQIFAIMRAWVELEHISVLGDYAVLGPIPALLENPLDPSEYLEPAVDPELKGMHWRKRRLPNFSMLAQHALSSPMNKAIIAAQMESLSYKQAIFFTRNKTNIAHYVVENSLGTIDSLEKLAEKDLIILLGSRGLRKAKPLLNALIHCSHMNVAVITMPAASGVDAQPFGHLQIVGGAKNRLDQLRCFRETLSLLLDIILNKKRHIACLSIENGIGILPAYINKHNRMQLETEPLLMDDGKTHCFYDQAHILFDFNGQTHHKITQPMHIGYTFLFKNKDELMTLQDDRNHYYQIQSEYAKEMISRLKHPDIGSPYPFIRDGSSIKTSDSLIQAVLEHWFSDFFSKKLSFNALRAELCLFKRVETAYLVDNRSTDPSIQHEYDKRFGLLTL